MEAQGGASTAPGGGGGRPSVAPGLPPAVVAGPPAFGHVEFSGHAEARLEPNGRVIIPSAYRYAFSEGVAVARPKAGDFLALYSRPGFNQFIDEAIARQPDLVLDPKLRGDAYAMAPKLTIDRQWRVVIPQEYRDEVGLGEDVVFIGAIESLKIMTPEKAEEVFERARMVNVILDSWGGLSTAPANPSAPPTDPA